MKEKRKDTRVRNWSCVCYCSEELLHLTLKDNLSKIYRYSYITHDKDIEDGKPKPVHIHLNVCFKNRVSRNIVRDLFSFTFTDGTHVNCLAKETDNFVGAQRYLCHLDNPEKAQYLPETVSSFNVDYFDYSDIAYEVPEYKPLDLMLANVPLREIARICGKDFIIHYTAYKKLYDDIIDQEKKERLGLTDPYYVPTQLGNEVLIVGADDGELFYSEA